MVLPGKDQILEDASIPVGLCVMHAKYRATSLNE